MMCWINADHRRYSQFVGFRISEISELTTTEEWHWVQSKENVADMGTKWKTAPDLSASSRWFQGPEFLWTHDDQWMRSTFECDGETEEELRPSLHVHYTTLDPVVNVERFSTWKRLHRVVAYVHRFSQNCQHRRRRQSKVTGPLTRDELRTAEHYLIRQAQQDAFPDEIAILRKHDQQTVSLPKSSVLHNLTPWLDAGGLLRMRGRISSCEYATEDAKNPIIMPRHHHTTRLIITDYHHKFHHMNHETVVNELRQKYRIPRVRSAYFTVRKSCQKCKNDSSTPRPSIMADLPKARLAAYSRPFTFTGIDYFGPIEVMTGRRREKRWGMIATCLTIRAIHIEVVNSLTTDSCIMAIRNFMSRRGIPQAFYSDRGTNFVGANRTLNEIFEAIDHEGIMNEFVTTETTWHFNPPTAPHMGGSWERLVRTVKNNLLAICPAQRLTDEILRNLLTEVENTINSRPLTHVPVDDESAEALTPNHFLLGASNGTKPLTTLVKFDGAALRKNFCASQVIANIFWKRWIMDYLPDITKRTKWFSHSKPITVGDIVIIVDRRLPRNCWPKGKVIATCTGKDSQVRSATVRTSNGVYERPTINLAVLDVRREDQ